MSPSRATSLLQHRPLQQPLPTLTTFSVTLLRGERPEPGVEHLPVYLAEAKFCVLRRVVPASHATWACLETAIEKLFIKIYDCHFLVQ